MYGLSQPRVILKALAGPGAQTHKYLHGDCGLMNGGRRLTIVLVFVAMVMAGCAGGDVAQGAGPGAPSMGGAGGADVAGNILDEGSLPIAGAQVGLFSLSESEAEPMTLQTPEDGSFAFADVDDGEYRLEAQAIGYKSQARRIVVGGPEPVTDITLVMADVPIASPYHGTQIRSLDIQLGLAWQVGGDFNQGCIVPGVTCQGLAYPGANVDFEVEELENNPLATLVIEETWEPNSIVCAKAIAIDLYGPETNSVQNPSFSNPHYWTNYPSEVWESTPPVVMVIPRVDPGNTDAIDDPERIEKNDGDPVGVDGTWVLRNFPPGQGLTNLPADANCFTEQHMDIYFTTFYVDPAPPGFSGRPDA